MKFYTKPILRFCYRYVALFLLVGLPICMSGYTDFLYGDDIWIYQVFCIFLAACGAVVIHFAFWEKFFAVLMITNDSILWKCPLRRNRLIPISECVEIGVYKENESHGIPTKQIYFSDHPDPQKEMDMNGVMKVSEHLIKFWYSDELYEYLIRNLPDTKTSCLLAYKACSKKY